MLYMKRLRIILIFSFIILFLYNLNPRSKYSLDEKNVVGVIDKYKFNGNKLEMEVKGKERIICNLYFNTIEEKEEYMKKIKLGQTVYLEGVMKEPSQNTNKYLFNYKKYLLSKKIYYTFTIKKIDINENISMQYKIKNSLIDRIEKLNSPYLYAFILGDTSFIESSIKSTYQSNGISHLLAISGMHITLLFSTIYRLLEKIKKTKFNILFIFILLFFYLFLVNFTPSSIRAGLMFFVLLLFKKMKSYKVLIFIFVLLISINPYYVYNIGFLLSFIVSFYILLFNDLIKGNYFQKLLMTSLISFIASMPVIIYNYNSINLLSVFLNLIFVPFVTYLVFPLSFVSLLFGFSRMYIFFTGIMENLSLFFDKLSISIILGDIGTFIIIYVVIGIFVLYKMKMSKYGYLLIYFVALFIHFNIHTMNPTITMFDVGQGDSILVELPNNKGNILIDTGGSYTEKWKKTNYSLAQNITISYLKKKGIKKLDYLILTHGDYDHMGESINLVENFKVEKVIFNCGEFNDLEKELIKVLEKKNIKYYSCIKELNIDNNKLYFLQTKEYDNENDNSNVIYTELDGYKFMFMGDAGVEKEKDILNKYNISGIDVLKIGHHGSKTSSSKEFINEINPNYSIISVGKNNRYGHPNKEVLNNLSDSKIYRTDQDGSIMFKIKNYKLQIETCSP